MSLLLSLSPATNITRSRPTYALIVGDTVLAKHRAQALVEAGYKVVVLIDREDGQDENTEIVSGISVTYRTCSLGKESTTVQEWTSFLRGLEFYDDLQLLVVTDTISLSSTSTSISTSCMEKTQVTRSYASASTISSACKITRILCCISDIPELSDFGWPVTLRWNLETNPLNGPDETERRKSSLQVAVDTGRKACRLGRRIADEIMRTLPADVAVAVEAIGLLRSTAKTLQDQCSPRTFSPSSSSFKSSETSSSASDEDSESLMSLSLSPSLNSPVPQLSSPTTSKCSKSRKNSIHTSSYPNPLQIRMRWISQISQFWPYDQIANTYFDTDARSRLLSLAQSSDSVPTVNRHSLESLPEIDQEMRGHTRNGVILLVGSGPGSPLLLPVITHRLLTTSFSSTIILSDKLVPSEILDLIPKTTKVVIAKKFPGNAEGAQSELMEIAVRKARDGMTVIRLKQGDPYIYGRGGEEVLHFRQRGIETHVIPGLSSALAGPLLAGIPLTQRGVSEGLIVCTGVGRGGKEVKIPGYEREKTVVMLMGVARIGEVVRAMTEGAEGRLGGNGKLYPKNLPVAVIERAGMKDARTVRSTLQHIQEAMEIVGQKPPGLIVAGWSVMALDGEGNLDVLERDEVRDEDVVEKWLAERKWRVEENGLKAWESFNTTFLS